MHFLDVPMYSEPAGPGTRGLRSQLPTIDIIEGLQSHLGGCGACGARHSGAAEPVPSLTSGLRSHLGGCGAMAPRLPNFLSQIFTDDMYVYFKVAKISR